MHARIENHVSYLAKHQRIRSAICCPSCKRSVELTDAAMLAGVPLAARIRCDDCGEIGRVANLKYVFTATVSTSHMQAQQLHGRLSVREMPVAAHVMRPEHAWPSHPSGMYFTEQADATLSLEVEGCIGISLDFLKHPWSGIVEIRVDGVLRDRIDLYEEAGSMRLWYPISFDAGRHRVEVRSTGARHPDSHASQLFMGPAECLEMSDGADEVCYESRNLGNPYPPRFLELLEKSRPDTLVLDCGSGDRCHPDPRVVNFEYSAFRSPDVLGDGHALPFKDNSFDLILSQAVMEHVYDPDLAASELLRVLKPGGVVYCESAFMQPLHAVPFHFFNTTRWGLERLFRNFEITEAGHEGSLGGTLEWIYALTALEARGFGPKVQQLLALARELDGHISHEELRQFASFVWMTARKQEVASC